MEEKAALAVSLHGTPVSGTIPDTSHPVSAPPGRYVHPPDHDAPGQAGPFLRRPWVALACHWPHSRAAIVSPIVLRSVPQYGLS